MRYFMITYAYKEKTNSGYGHYFHKGEYHPSISTLTNSISCPVVIMNIHEFNSLEDYTEMQK